MSACSTDIQNNTSSEASKHTDASSTNFESTAIEVPENYVLVKGGTFQMDSPDAEAWRPDDETQHTVTVSDFYYEHI